MHPQSKTILNSIALLTLCLGSAVTARADFITASPGGTVVNFSQFSPVPTFTSGPVQVGGLVSEDITWSTTNAGAVIGNVQFGFLTNGLWNSGRNGFTTVGGFLDTMTFRFNSSPVSTVGGFINYTPGSISPSVIISALDINGNVLESYDVSVLAPISTPNQVNAGAFRGISRVTADIFAFTLSNRGAALDDLTFSRQQSTPAPVPEPATMLLFGTGMFGICAAARQRRKSV